MRSIRTAGAMFFLKHFADMLSKGIADKPRTGVESAKKLEELLPLVKKERIERGFITFSINEPISEEQSLSLQDMLGYNICGYGHYSFSSNANITTWQCSDSCD